LHSFALRPRGGDPDPGEANVDEGRGRSMKMAEFELRLNLVRRRRSASMPADFEPFEFLTASDQELRRVEDELGAVLPAQYREFMMRYGGGEFLFLDLVPVGDLVSVNRFEQVPDFVVIAPVGTGDSWGFDVSDGVCGDEVSFWFHDDRRREPDSADFLEFLSAKGLRYSESG
jgi:antitoxin YobK